MKYSIFKKLKISTLEQCGVTLQGVTGNTLRVYGKAQISFKMGPVKMRSEFIIVNQMNRNLILGRDWLMQYGVRLYFDLKKIKVKGAFLPLEEDIHIASLLRIDRDTILKPNSVHLVRTNVKRLKYFSPGQDFQISTVSRGMMAEQPELTISDAVVKLERYNDIPVMILNTANKTQRIRKGTVIARLETMKGCQVNSIDQNGEEKHTPTFEDSIRTELQCPQEYTKKIADLCRRNRDCFAMSDSELGRTQTVKMDIDTGDSPPVRVRPYRTPLQDRPVIEEAINDMMRAGVISRSPNSEYSSPMILVKKEDGSNRFCVDYRRLNQVTKPVAYPLPIIDDILGQLDKAKYISTLDMKSGFWSIPLTERAKDKSTFSSHLGAFKFNVMPFGMKNSPAIFCSLIDKVLKDASSFATAYMDDIIVFSHTLEEHMRHLEEVFERLRTHKLRLKLKKCQFLKPETKYLGFIISPEGVKPDPQKVKAIRELPEPTTTKECRGVIGLMSYYRRFIVNFSQIAEPLIDLCKKYSRFKWTKECATAFKRMKESIAEVPMLCHPDLSASFVLYTDASDKCIGAALVQEAKDGEEIIPGIKNERPIYFISHKLNKTQQKYSTIEKEAYAIFYALSKLNVYLHSSKFIIKTDHYPLKYLLSSPMTNDRIQRWALSIAGYDCTIEYIKGTENTCADLLSRQPPADEVTENEDVIPDIPENTYEINVINSNQIDPKDYAQYKPPVNVVRNVPEAEFDVIAEQAKDEDICDIKKKLESGETDKKIMKRFVLLEQKVYFINETPEDVTFRLYVPQHLIQRMIEAYHTELGHYGVEKVYKNLKIAYYWKNMYKDVHTFISECHTCKLRSITENRAPLQATDIPPFPFAKLSIDVSGSYPTSLSGNKYIVHFVDHLSLWPECFPTPDKTSQTIATLLIDEIIPRFGAPLEITTDNGPENIGRPLQDTLKELNIHHRPTTAWRPQSNSRNERMHRTLHDILSKKASEQPETWDLHLNSTLAALRTNVSDTTGFSPYQLVYQRHPILPLDRLLCPRQKYHGQDQHQLSLQAQHKAFLTAYQNTVKSQKQNKKYYDKTAKTMSINVGDHVYYKNFYKESKLSDRWIPYYTVIEKLGRVTFKIKNQLTALTKKAHANQLKLACINWDSMLSKQNSKSGRNNRKSTMVVPELSDPTDSTVTEIPNEDIMSDIVRANRNERSNSSNESDIPLLELRNRMRERQRREEQQREYTSVEGEETYQDINSPDEQESNLDHTRLSDIAQVPDTESSRNKAPISTEYSREENSQADDTESSEDNIPLSKLKERLRMQDFNASTNSSDSQYKKWNPTNAVSSSSSDEHRPSARQKRKLQKRKRRRTKVSGKSTMGQGGDSDTEQERIKKSKNSSMEDKSMPEDYETEAGRKNIVIQEVSKKKKKKELKEMEGMSKEIKSQSSDNGAITRKFKNYKLPAGLVPLEMPKDKHDTKQENIEIKEEKTDSGVSTKREIENQKEIEKVSQKPEEPTSDRNIKIRNLLMAAAQIL